MTKLPPGLEKLIEQNANEYGVQSAKHFHDRLPATKFFGIPQEPFDGKPDFQTMSAYRAGATKYALEILAHAQKLADALKSAELVVTQSMYEGSMSSEDLETLQANQETCFHEIREARAEWNEFVGDGE